MPEHRALISMGVAVLARLSTADLRVRFFCVLNRDENFYNHLDK